MKSLSIVNNFITYVFMLFFISFCFGSKSIAEQEYVYPGPNLSNLINIKIYGADKDKSEIFCKSIIYNNNIIYFTKEPLLNQSDYQYIKLIKCPDPGSTDRYCFIVKLFKPSKLETATRLCYTKRMAYLINYKIRDLPVLYVILTEGIFHCGFYTKNEIISLIGIKTFNEYIKIFNSN